MSDDAPSSDSPSIPTSSRTMAAEEVTRLFEETLNERIVEADKRASALFQPGPWRLKARKATPETDPDGDPAVADEKPWEPTILSAVGSGELREHVTLVKRAPFDFILERFSFRSCPPGTIVHSIMFGDRVVIQEHNGVGIEEVELRQYEMETAPQVAAGLDIVINLEIHPLEIPAVEMPAIVWPEDGPATQLMARTHDWPRLGRITRRLFPKIPPKPRIPRIAAREFCSWPVVRVAMLGRKPRPMYYC